MEGLELKSKGFTLLEVMIVLIMISLSISLVIPSLARFSKKIELRTAAQKVSTILRYCRNEAVQKGKVQQVLFNPELREIKVQSPKSSARAKEDIPAEDPNLEKKYILPPGVQIKEVKIPASAESDSLSMIEFYPNGGSSGGSVVLESQDLKGYRIKVDFLTGLVGVEGI